MDTRSVLNQHFAAFSAGDVDAVLACRSDDSTMITASGVIRGHAALRTEFAGYFAGLFKPGTYAFALDAMQIDEDLAYITWHARCASADVIFGTDTFVIRNGTIAAHTWAAKIEPR
jgi:ketosteroid isomerase-like protein